MQGFNHHQLLQSTITLLGLWSLCLCLPTASAQKLQGEDETTCRLMTLIPFTDQRESIPRNNTFDPEILKYGYGVWPSEKALHEASFSLLATAEMAIRHFNSRDTSIVPELAEIPDSCPIQLDSVYVDSAYRRDLTLNQLSDYMWRTGLEEGVESLILSNGTAINDQDDFYNQHPDNLLCAVVGPIEARSNEGVSALTETWMVPQLGYATIDHRLDKQKDFPMFRRIIPKANDFGLTLPEYIQRGDVWVRECAGVIYEYSDYGEQFENPLEDAEELYDYLTMTESIVEGEEDTIWDSLRECIREGFRTVVLIMERPSFMIDVANVAEELGMLDGDYFWIISGDAFPPALNDLQFEAGSPVDKMLKGSALFTNYDRFVYKPEEDRFLQIWRQQDGTSILTDLLEKRPVVSDEFSPDPSNYFASTTPTLYASYMYDTIITAGVSACQAYASQGTKPHAEAVMETEFNGASGKVSFYSPEEESLGTSRVGDALYGMYNIRPLPAEDGEQRGYEKVLTALYDPNKEWTYDLHGEVSSGTGAWEKLEEHIFSDGSTQEPLPLRRVVNAHYLPKWMQLVGLILVGIALLICVGTGIWVYVQRKTRLVQASQPEFIYLLCFGSALVAISLVFVSFDEDKGVSTGALSFMCTSFPWFFVLGYLCMYAALYSKLWRLSKLMNLRRCTVGIQQALYPFAAVLSASIVVLVVWTAVDPLVWERVMIVRQPLETFGECKTSGNMLFYLVPLFLLIVGQMSMTAYFSWKMKDVQSELSESKWIFFGIFCHLQIWVLGIPMVIITDDVSKGAWYLMITCLAFIFSTTMVIAVVWPRLFTWVRDTYLGGPAKPKTQISITRGTSTRVSGLPMTGLADSQAKLLRSGSSLPLNTEMDNNSLSKKKTSASVDSDSVKESFKVPEAPPVKLMQ